MPDLNPDQFFHGTTHNIKDGMVRPADHAGKNVSEYSMGDPGDMSEGDHAFVTKDEDYAWKAASIFHENGRRPRVYETGSAPDMKPGPWNKEHPDYLAHHELQTLEVGGETYHPDEESVKYAHSQHQPEYASKTGFPVRSRIDIMPGRQGTFPEVNWNTHRAINDGSGPRAPRDLGERRDAMSQRGLDANHPTDHEVLTSTSGRKEQDKFEHEKAIPQAANLREYMAAPAGRMKPPPKKDKGQLPLF